MINVILLYTVEVDRNDLRTCHYVTCHVM